MTRSTPATAAPPAVRRTLTTLGAGLLLSLALGVSAPAYAHDELLSSRPADGDSLAQPPAQVVLTFEEAPVDLGLQVVVTSPDGLASSGSPRVEGATVVQDVQPGAPAGRYTVEWRVTSDDGHPVSGRFGFTAQAAGASGSASGGTTVAASPTASATATPAPADGDRREPLIPSWGWIVAGVIVIVAAIRVNRQSKAAHQQQED